MVLRVFLVLFQGFVVGATIGVGFLETLVAAIVPVDGIDRGCQSAYDERQFPVTFVIDLSGTGEDRGQCRGFLYGGGVVAVVDRRIAQEVKVGGDRKPDDRSACAYCCGSYGTVRRPTPPCGPYRFPAGRCIVV